MKRTLLVILTAILLAVGALPAAPIPTATAAAPTTPALTATPSGALQNSFDTGTAGQPYGLTDWASAGWNAPWLLGDGRSQVDGTISHSGGKSLKVLYPQGKIGPEDSGYQSPFQLPSADEYYLSYWVRFSQDFSWGTTEYAGKVGIGLAGGGACSGGEVCTGENGFSSRLIWRKGGQAAIYYYSMGHEGEYGDYAVLQHNGSDVYYPKEQWVNIVQRLKVNTVTNGQANPDGEIEIWYNGQSAAKITGLRFVTNADKVDKAYFSSFAGGATASFAPANDSYIWYDDVKVSTNSADICELNKGGCSGEWDDETTDPLHDLRIRPVSVTASTYEEGNGPENTLDDDLTTRWSAEGEQWIRYDLGESRELSQVSVAFYQGHVRSTKLRIEGSDDGDTWTTLFEGQSAGNTTEPEPFVLTDAKARYIRIAGSGNTVNQWNSISEVRIYGVQKDDPGGPPLKDKLVNAFETGTAGQPYGLADWTQANWTAKWLLGDDRSQIDDGVSHSGFKSLKVLYPKGKIGPEASGYQAPFELKSADEYYLSYWVRFSEDFSWGTKQFGGKLGIGLAGGAACSGGQICTGENGFSSRLIWRKDGQAAVYIYSMGNAGQYGDEADLNYRNGSPVYYPKGTWFNIVQRVKVNTVTNGQANPDGEVEIWYNGQHATKVTGLRFVTNADKVDKAYFSSFFGGATDDYVPANDSYVWYDDVKVSTRLADMCELSTGGCDYSSDDPMAAYRIQPVGVTDSGHEEGNGPENTIDGDLSTRWSSEGEQWIRYDLGESRELSQASIAFFQGAARSTIFRLEGSDDGDTWRTLFDGQSSGRFTDLEPFALNNAKARYIRIAGSGNTINKWNSITEIRFYGTEENGGGDPGGGNEPGGGIEPDDGSDPDGGNDPGTGTPSADRRVNSFELGTAGQPYGLNEWRKMDWTAKWLLGDARSQVDADVSHSGFKSLKVLYPKGKIGPEDSGYQAPFEVKPADEYYLSYWVRFDENFSWGTKQFGGKLGIGLAGGAACSGGQICTGENGFSSRLIWRKDGQAAVYIYSMGNAGQYGDEADLNYRNGSPVYYPKGEWFNIVQRVKVNTVTNGQANPDGEVEIWYNGQHATKVTGLRFVTNADKVDKAYFSSFFGGATEDYVPANDSYVWYDDVKVSPHRADMCELNAGGCDYAADDPLAQLRIQPVGVTDSGHEEGNGPEKTIDGDLSTRWSAEGEQWIRYDLGKSRALSQISIAFFQGAARSTIFRIEVSDDGDTWRTLFDGKSSGRFTDLEPFALDDAKGRYIRLSGSGNTINKWNSITEVRIYGTSGDDGGDPDNGNGNGNGNNPDNGNGNGNGNGNNNGSGNGNQSGNSNGSGGPSGQENPGNQLPEAELKEVMKVIAYHWAKADLIRAAELKIWDLPPVGQPFNPNKPVNRAEWVQLLVRALGLEAPDGATPFADVSGLDDEQQRAAAAAFRAGIVTGFEDGSFRPKQEVTRAQMAVMLARALKLSASSVPPASAFADDKSLPAWARDSVYALSRQGVLRGRGGQTFQPGGNATFAESIVALLRAIDLSDAQA
ncbi:polysaccharide lyase [Cohnella sp. GCM10012308]|uniref:polysaccharide lyase n=1 Tax=Cohnella sp. GCM10012308 TaxID=3317329 RepID=UPI00361C043A